LLYVIADTGQQAAAQGHLYLPLVCRLYVQQYCSIRLLPSQVMELLARQGPSSQGTSSHARVKALLASAIAGQAQHSSLKNLKAGTTSWQTKVRIVLESWVLGLGYIFNLVCLCHSSVVGVSKGLTELSSGVDQHLLQQRYSTAASPGNMLPLLLTRGIANSNSSG
jgi:hypothetical protein